MPLKFFQWKTIGYLFYTTLSSVHHFKASNEFKLELQSGNAQFGLKSTIFHMRDLEIWGMTLKNNRAPLLSNIMLCTSFHHHMWIQTGVLIRKRPNGVLISVTLTFDLWPTLTFCMDITSVIGNNSWNFHDTMTGTLWKIAIWGWQTPQLPRPEKAPKISRTYVE